jgi:hypothetical protein
MSFDEQTFRIVLQQHLDAMKATGDADIASALEREITQVFGKYQLALLPSEPGFPVQHIDAGILVGLGPIEKGYVHFLAGQQHIYKNGTVLPFAASMHLDAAPFVLTYLLDNHEEIVPELLDDAVTAARRRLNDTDEIEQEARSREEYQDYGEPPRLLTVAEFREEIVRERAEVLERTMNVMVDTRKNIGDSRLIIGRELMKVSGPAIAIIDPHYYAAIRTDWNASPRVENATVYAIADQYRLNPAHKACAIIGERITC